MKQTNRRTLWQALGRPLSALAIMGLSGCISFTSTAPSDQYDGPIKVDVFAARGFLSGSDYEHYVLDNSVLWRECGSVAPRKPSTEPDKPKMEGDDLLARDPSLVVQQRRAERLSSDQRAAAVARAIRLFNLLEQSPSDIPPPGGLFSLTQPGLVELTLNVGDKKRKIITSVDAISDPNSPALEAANGLYATLRGIGPAICGTRTFFGIPDRK